MMLLAAAWLLCCARARARNATSRALAAPPDRRCKDEPRCLNELGDEVFDRAVDALRRCKKRDDAYLSCDLGDGWYGWTTEFYRFARAKIRPDGGLALLEGFDIPSCSGRSHRGSPQDRFCEFAREGVNDREAVFLANPWGGNFQHFMFELLPRAWVAAELLRRARPDAPPPELVLGPHMRQAFHVESVRLATGLAPKIIGDMENQPAYGHVWVPPYAAENFGDWSALGLKALREIHGDLQRRFVSGPPTKRLAYLLKDFEKLKGEVAGREAFRTQLEQLAGCQIQAPEATKPLVEERMAELYGKITWSDPARGLVVCLLCGGMGACVYAMYSVGLKIARVINWEIDRLARKPLEKFCRAKGIEYESPMPSAARARREEAPGAAVPVEGNVCRLTAADVPADVDVLSSTGPCQDLSRANARREGYSGANATPHFANSAFLWRAAARRAPGNAGRFDRPRRQALRENPKLQILCENVIKEGETQARARRRSSSVFSAIVVFHRTRTLFSARACPSCERTRGPATATTGRGRSTRASRPRTARSAATRRTRSSSTTSTGRASSRRSSRGCPASARASRRATARSAASPTARRTPSASRRRSWPWVFRRTGSTASVSTTATPGASSATRCTCRSSSSSTRACSTSTPRATATTSTRNAAGPSPSPAAAPRRPSTSSRAQASAPATGASTAHL